MAASAGSISFTSIWTPEEAEIFQMVSVSLQSTLHIIVDTARACGSRQTILQCSETMIRTINDSMKSSAKSHGFMYIISYSVRELRNIVLALREDFSDENLCKTVSWATEILFVMEQIPAIERQTRELIDQDFKRYLKHYRLSSSSLAALKSPESKFNYIRTASVFLCDLFFVIGCLQLPPFSFPANHEKFEDLYHNTAVLISNSAAMLWQPGANYTEIIQASINATELILTQIAEIITPNLKSLNLKITVPKPLPHRKPAVPLRPLDTAPEPPRSRSLGEAAPGKFVPVARVASEGRVTSSDFGSRPRVMTTSSHAPSTLGPPPPVPASRNSTNENQDGSKVRLVRSQTSGNLPRPDGHAPLPPDRGTSTTTTPARSHPGVGGVFLESILKPFEQFPWFTENWQNQTQEQTQICLARVINIIRGYKRFS